MQIATVNNWNIHVCLEMEVRRQVKQEVKEKDKWERKGC